MQHSAGRTALVLAALVPALAIACRKGEQPPRAGTEQQPPAGAAPAPAPGTTPAGSLSTGTPAGSLGVGAPGVRAESAGGALATRAEAQASFDSARIACGKSDFSACSTHLRAAATFLRTEATGSRGNQLTRSANELDTLAAQAARGAMTSVRPLDAALVRAQAAEAQYHLDLATDAWARKDNRRTGDHLTMAVDHFERAARDAGYALDSAGRGVLANSRQIAEQLIRGGSTTAADVGKATDALGREIRKFASSTPRAPTP